MASYFPIPIFGVVLCLCLFVSVFARPLATDEESVETVYEDPFGNVIDPHRLLKELFADRPLKFNKRGGAIWGNKRHDLPALREIKKMRCYFNPVSC
uniref:Uncharacterized protein n=1 Tax=Plectus sambesii TaxID=2011161 RepID=A0A914XV60_9BILA